MLTDKIKMKAKAAQLGVEGYRNMTTEQLQAAIESAEKATPTKGAVKPTNGTTTKGKATAAIKTATKGRANPPDAQAQKEDSVEPKPKRQPASKTTATKAAPAKITPAKGAKTSKPSPAKSETQKSSPTVKAAKGTAKRTATGGTKGKHVGVQTGPRVPIDVSTIDWDAESNVGRVGKRKDILDALREFKGDRVKAFEKLAKSAVKWFPNASRLYPSSPSPKAASERQLKWLIARITYDFAYKTGQHVGRAGEGGKTNVRTVKDQTATTINDLAKQTAATKGKKVAALSARTTAARKAAPKPPAAVKAPAKGKVAPKPASKPAARTKAPVAPKGKTAPARGGLAVKGR